MLRHFWTIAPVMVLSAIETVSAQGFAPMDSVARNNELSIDVNGFIRQFVPNNSDPLGYNYAYQPTYVVAYKHGVGRSALRFGLGGLYTLDSDTGGYNSHTDYTDYSWRVHVRAGWERRWTLNRRWSCYAGLDGLFGTGRGIAHNFNTQAGRPDVRTTFKSYGAGPVLGIQFHLNRRIALYTETSLYWLYQESGTHYDFPDDANDRKGLNTRATILLTYPVAVWFAVAF